MERKKPRAARRTKESRAAEAGPPPAENVAHDIPPPVSGEDADNWQTSINEKLARTVISLPLLKDLEPELEQVKTAAAAPLPPHSIIIDVNLNYPGGRARARERIWKLIRLITKDQPDQTAQGVNAPKSIMSRQYLFARLDAAAIQELIRLDRSQPSDLPATSTDIPPAPNAIWSIWPDFEVTAQITRSISTVKADAAQRSFASSGDGITWAVLDSGIDATHPHFTLHKNLELPSPLRHMDFTMLSGKGDSLADVLGAQADSDPDLFPHLNFMGLLEKLDQQSALVDVRGHGTHVAGIIAGEIQGKIRARVTSLDEFGRPKPGFRDFPAISGMAPKCKLVSLKVLDDKGRGPVSNVVAALAAIQEINGYGRWLRIHGINLSVGYEFNPEWFACGQSPLCVEVDRLVKSGVVIVAAAGNTGFGTAFSTSRKTDSAGLGMTINDPGNAELAITVGSTHREMPHVYGISYFSSKGPTGDGRNKPDLVAPGEKIISCASTKPAAAGDTATTGTSSPAAATGQPALAAAEAPASAPSALSASPASAPVSTAAAPAIAPVTSSDAASDVITDQYQEMSGTSMAAPHVSGVIAAFMSVRREFIGRPEEIKQIFISTATDLKRNPYFQGHGLVDLMRAIQSV
ncbi:MAG: S8 family peptidase [Blastocatellia bacterium]